ncbi:MAG TPA: CRISPR-associated protein Cas5 [Exilispira sp.]|jgi:CRISPR-associated protein Cas5h|nr:CRISPR-associated protein Cas5 [Candidatus Gracilibacteria bacterium]HPO59990.1 CRISPR-associated protein Cas5 [Exilispira sp.]
MNEKILIFNIKGKFAHFKKYYSNKSSLTYKLPPSTVIMGIIASVLQESRDTYYYWLDPDKSKIGVKILKNGNTHFECMNYLFENGHTQTRLELLMAKENYINYKIYFYTNEKEKFDEFERKIEKREYGYGIYLGQRQFIADIDIENTYFVNNIHYIKSCNLSTLTYKENVITLSENNSCKLNVDMMPISFKNEKDGKSRISELKSQVIFEENGKSINGTFIEVIEISNGEIISFFTPFDKEKYNENKLKIPSR